MKFDKVSWAQRMRDRFSENVDRHLENENLSIEDKLKKVSNYFEDSLTLIDELIAHIKEAEDKQFDLELDRRFEDTKS